jgi:hypothetical protein
MMDNYFPQLKKLERKGLWRNAHEAIEFTPGA